jgi:hypothetical protein
VIPNSRATPLIAASFSYCRFLFGRQPALQLAISPAISHFRFSQPDLASFVSLYAFHCVIIFANILFSHSFLRRIFMDRHL